MPGSFFAPGPRQHRAGVGLVRALVLGEAHVAVDAEQRRLAVALERRFRLGEAGREVLDQIAERPLDLVLVDRAVGLEPVLGLVEGERLEEGNGLRAEAGKGHGANS